MVLLVITLYFGGVFYMFNNLMNTGAGSLPITMNN